MAPRALVVALVLCAALPARAVTVVQSCADTVTFAGAAVAGAATFTIDLARDPATANPVATLRLTAFDPDNDDEVAIAVNGTVLPAFTEQVNSDWNNEKFSYVEPIATNLLVKGANTITVTDGDGGDPFTLHRLCIGLVDAAPAVPRPATERFCDPTIRAPSFSVDNDDGDAFSVSDGQNETTTIGVDVAVDPQAGFEILTSIAGSGTLTYTLGRAGATTLTASQLVATTGDQVFLTAPLTATTLVGAVGANALTFNGNATTDLWELCILVAPTPVAAADAGFVAPDAGSTPTDGGGVASDAGFTPTDAGFVLDDSGTLVPADSGTVGEGEGEGEGEPNDGGPTRLPNDDGGSAVGGIAAARAVAARELTSPDFQANGGCAAATTGAGTGALVGAGVVAGLVGALASRRRRR